MKTSLLKFGDTLRFEYPQVCQYLRLHLHLRRCQRFQRVEHYQLLDGCVRYLYPQSWFGGLNVRGLGRRCCCQYHPQGVSDRCNHLTNQLCGSRKLICFQLSRHCFQVYPTAQGGGSAANSSCNRCRVAKSSQHNSSTGGS